MGVWSRSTELVLQRYNTDKIANGYLKYYDTAFQHLLDVETKVLEIGVHQGASLLLWRDYFPTGTIAGIDLHVPDGFLIEERIRIFQGDQTDTTFLSSVAEEIAPDGFDAIIDDASHIGASTKIAFWHLFDNHLKNSGLYVIEDWGTGYWEDWYDGRTYRPRSYLRSSFWRGLQKFGMAKIPWHNHSYGMVGFIKQLIDEQGAADLTTAHRRGTPTRTSKFERMVITPSIVFITKSA